MTVPNGGIDRIFIQFDEPVVGFQESNLKLLGVAVADYAGVLTVNYDSGNTRGLIQLSSNIAVDKLRIGISDQITDLTLNSLDGDSNGSAGGVLDFRFNVLVGDASSDGSVNGGDLSFFASSFNRSAGDAGYDVGSDWNSDGSVNGGDLSFFATNFNQSLPAFEPAPVTFAVSRIAKSTKLQRAALVDAFFTRINDKDEFVEDN
jgi:hypothetical protein